MTEALRIGIAGLGTVGQGVIHILRENADLIAARCGRPIVIVAAGARDTGKKRTVSLDGIRIETDAVALASAADIDVVVELIGGHDGVAKTLVEQSLANGKSVITANKALLAHHGIALAKAAEEKGVTLAFEAAVAGGIPIIAALRQGLSANRITRISGILNGTCNYILTSMSKQRRDYPEMLAEAAALGYLEADPSLDIDGIDAAHKVAILASLAFGTSIDFAAVHAEGIRHITLADIDYAASFGYTIKLLGIASMEGGALLQRVQPCLVPTDSPLGVIDGAGNAVQVEGDAVGRVVFEGRGAGGGPTGSAVISDIMAIARGDRFPPFHIPTHAQKKAVRADITACQSRYYVRLTLKDEPGVLAEITRAFANETISVHSMTQKVHPTPLSPEAGATGGANAQVIVLTHMATAASIARAVAAIGTLPINAMPPVLLRIEAS